MSKGPKRREPPQLDLVIPALNEAATLPALLRAAGQQQGISIRSIVADGGSTDDTVGVAANLAGRVVSAAAGRAVQMNAGAAAGDAPWLVFLHADSGFTSATQLADAVAALKAHDGTRVAGHFPLRFVREQAGARRFYRYLEAKTTLNRPETWNGDQGLVIAREWFVALGGFPELLPFLEDQLLGDRLRAEGELITLPGVLETSARRFEREGEAARYIVMMLIMCARRTGMTEFFRRAPGIYRNQDQTSALDAAPYLELFAELAGDDMRVWDELGAYTLNNAWQPMFALQVLSGDRMPLLPFFDRRIAPRLDGPRLRRWMGRILRRAVLPLLRRSLRS